MTLNPGLLNPTYGYQGAGNGLNSPIGFGIGPGMAAFGNTGLGFGQGIGSQQFGQFAQQAYGNGGGGPIDDIADDIAERIADEIADQAATGAAALFHSQMPQATGHSVGGLNVKRWLNGTRVTDAVRESVKQSAHQLSRHAVAHLLNVIQTQWPGATTPQFGQFGGLQAPGLAAYGGGQGIGQGVGPANVAQLAPVVASILGILQAHGQNAGQGLYGMSGRQN